MMKEERGKIAKTIFYFLHSDELNSCTDVVTGKAVNKKDRMSMQILCKPIFSRSMNFIEKLEKKIYCMYGNVISIKVVFLNFGTNRIGMLTYLLVASFFHPL